MFNNSSQHFKVFAKNLEETLKQYDTAGDKGAALLESQRQQIRELITLENKMRLAFIKSSRGPLIYKKFIKYICEERKNILAARPFFRERQSVFTKNISGALKKRNEKTLFKYRINYTFVLFALKYFKWGPNSKITKLAGQISNVRKKITELNMPLAISQARMFYAKTPKSHLSWMDLVQIHCCGLLVAVDKFVPPDTSNMTNEESLQTYRKFRPVAIGRMMSDRIESYSETSLHFFPDDKKLIYRALKALKNFKNGINYKDLADIVNEDIESDSKKTDANEIAHLIAAASTVSGDTVAPGVVEGELQTTIERYSTADVEQSFEEDVVKKQSFIVMKQTIKNLPMIYKKIIKLKGVTFDDNAS